MRLKRGASTRRSATRSDETALATPTYGAAWIRRGVGGLVLIALVAVLLAWWQGKFHTALPPPLPANLDQLEPDVARLIRSKVQQVEADPNTAAVYGDLGLVYEANQLWTDARAAFERAVDLQPDDRRWRLHLAMAAQEVGDFPTALAELRTLVQADPALAPAQQRLGYALLETGEWDAARTAFERVIALVPRGAEGYVGLASVSLRQGDAAAAARLLEQALLRDPQYPVAHHLLGTAYGQLGRQQEAERHLALGLDANLRYLPDSLTSQLTKYAVNAKALVSVGGRQLADGQIDQAVVTLERVLRIDPTNVSAMNNLAVAFVHQKRLDDAHRVLQQAVKLDPSKYLTYINLANWAKLTGDAAQALKFADQAVERAPQVDITHRTRAVYLAQEGRLAEALASARKAAELNPRDPRTQALCADLCLKQRDFSAAAGYYRQTAELTPRRVEPWLGLMQASLSAGNVAEATNALEQARQLAPDHPQVRRWAERLSAPAPNGASSPD